MTIEERIKELSFVYANRNRFFERDLRELLDAVRADERARITAEIREERLAYQHVDRLLDSVKKTP